MEAPLPSSSSNGSQSDGALSVEGLEALVAGWMTGERFHGNGVSFWSCSAADAQR